MFTSPSLYHFCFVFFLFYAATGTSQTPVPSESPASTIIYVNASATGTEMGDSWANAYSDLQAALDAASSGTEIWVAAGTYKPTTGTDRTISFVMKNGVAIYGGFPNTGNPDMEDRDWETNETILSGDLNGNDNVMGSCETLIITNNDENSYHVIFNDGNGLDETAVLDGFTITGGNADGSTGQGSFGGGMYNNEVSPTIVNCIFQANSASSDGGGMLTGSGAPAITNCVFFKNKAVNGGGMSNFFSSPQITNCTFTQNSASVRGGGLSVNATDPVLLITNSIIWENGGDMQIAISGAGTSVIVNHSIADEVYEGTGNIDAAPLFVDAANGDLRLLPCSPAVNAGDGVSGTSINMTTVDLNGNPRFFNDGVIDMGAYELQESPPAVNALCQSQTVTLGPDQTGSLPASDLNNESTGCDLVFTVDDAETLQFGCEDIGQPQVTLTATDIFGQNDTCHATVTITDPNGPTAQCGNRTVNLTSEGITSIDAAIFDGGSSAICGELSFAASQADFDCSDLGAPFQITLTVTSLSSGLTDDCQATVTVEDPESYCCDPPVAVCNDFTAELCWNGTVGISAADIAGSSEATCGIRSEQLSQSIFTCDDLGPQAVTYSITGLNGDSDQCTSTVTVVPGTTLPPPFLSTDIGPGSNHYDYLPCKGELALSATALNPISGPEDHLAFVSAELCGDFTFEVRLDSLNGNFGYAGIMARETHSPGARQVSLLANLTSLLRWERRQVTDGPKSVSLLDGSFPQYLRLERSGSQIFGYSSASGNSFQLIGAAQAGNNTCLEVGIATFTIDPTGTTRSVLSEIRYQDSNGVWSIEGQGLDSSPISPLEYTSVTSLNSAGTVAPSTEVAFRAGQSITLEPGFHAMQGAAFTARIEECLPASANAFWGGSPDLEGVDIPNPFSAKTGESTLHVFPNPFRNQATIALHLAEDRNVDIRLYDLSGRLVDQLLPNALQGAGENQYLLDGDRIAPGVYILIVQAGEKQFQKRLVIMR